MSRSKHLRNWIIEESERLGFLKVGFTRPVKPPFLEAFRAWIGAGCHGDMAWLERKLSMREYPTRLLRGAKTLISLAFPYSAAIPYTSDGYRVARYTQPQFDDYHARLRRKASTLVQKITECYPKSVSRIFVDSAPLLERSFAYAAGLGFIGKNNMLIIPGHGSFLYLTEILTTTDLDFPEHKPLLNQCGSCSKCISACPTGALHHPFHLDASKCLSYLTIEFKGAINPATSIKLGDCFYGCDRCQEVCPYNPQEKIRTNILPATFELLAMDDKGFKRTFGKTALNRSGLRKLKNNIKALKERL
jgi:epoxyqueuosine reductase